MTEEHLATRHFSLVEVCDGVHATIARDSGWAVGNAGIVDMGDRILVFDSFVNQNVAADLRAVGEHRFGGRVEYVVNSHRHGDHVKGNQAFKGARIISTTTTRDAMAKLKANSFSQPDELRRSYEEELSRVLSDPGDPDFALDEGYMRGHLDGLASLEYTLPDLTFESSLRLHGEKRTAEVISFGGGHTESDTLLYLPEDGVAFLGDLLFIGYRPYFADGDPDEFLRILDTVEGLGASRLIPGHGPVGSTGDMGPVREYVIELQRAVDRIARAGGGLAEVLRTTTPEACRGWKWRRFDGYNLEFLYRKRTGQPAA